jgi:hypothetical protein
MNLLDAIDCEIVPAINTGNFAADNTENFELYLKLTKKGEEKGYCPVLIRKDIGADYFWGRHGYCEPYPKNGFRNEIERNVQKATATCFKVWMGRQLYNYFLDEYDNTSDVDELLDFLESVPLDDDYLEIFERVNIEKPTMFGDLNKDFAKEYVDYQDYCFALIPTTNPWEVPAWFPIGAFNFCPPNEYHIALAKELYERYHARVMYMELDSMTFYVETPLIKQSEVEQLAEILITFDSDKFEDYEVAAKLITGKYVWRLWWD